MNPKAEFPVLCKRKEKIQQHWLHFSPVFGEGANVLLVHFSHPRRDFYTQPWASLSPLFFCKGETANKEEGGQQGSKLISQGWAAPQRYSGTRRPTPFMLLLLGSCKEWAKEAPDPLGGLPCHWGARTKTMEKRLRSVRAAFSAELRDTLHS